MSAITKLEIMGHLFDCIGLNKNESREIIDAIFEEISLCLEQEKDIQITGFGKFVLHDKKARPGRNPRTGIPVTISPRKVVTFHAGQKLQNKIGTHADA